MSNPNKIAVLILAAGKGKRMGSGVPKVLRELYGKPLVGHLLGTVEKLEVERSIAITPDLEGEVASAISKH